jgi:hypothetical protein
MVIDFAPPVSQVLFVLCTSKFSVSTFEQQKGTTQREDKKISAPEVPDSNLCRNIDYRG